MRSERSELGARVITALPAIALALFLVIEGGLVFTGDAEGFFTAYDASTGQDLWHFQCGSGHHGSPITYTLDGKQYIAVCVGWGGWTAGFAGDGAPWLRDARRGNTQHETTRHRLRVTKPEDGLGDDPQRDGQ